MIGILWIFNLQLGKKFKVKNVYLFLFVARLVSRNIG